MRSRYPFAILFLAAVVLPLPSEAQRRIDSPLEAEVLRTLEQFYEALNRADATSAQALFHPSAPLVSTMRGVQGAGFGSVADYVSGFVLPSADFHHIRISNPTVLVSGTVAVFWVDFEYYREGRLYFCGAETAQLVRSRGTWQITSMANAVQQEGCDGRELPQEP